MPFRRWSHFPTSRDQHPLPGAAVPKTTVPTESLLGSPDIQSLADLANGAQTVRKMRTVPAGRGLLTMYAAALAAPFLPLLLIKYPLVELAAVLVKRLFGA